MNEPREAHSVIAQKHLPIALSIGERLINNKQVTNFSKNSIFQ